MGFFPVGVPFSLRFDPGPWSKQAVTTPVRKLSFLAQKSLGNLQNYDKER